ncbi:MAG: heat-shock protein [Alteromonadaceae bacterium]|jgi:ribosome-associated heat shock protein Hsp15|nr:heat-shock protein [Alteromonadaceae bacterium]MBB20936.1 heat-shock protein [Rickettsiales bacterium]
MSNNMQNSKNSFTEQSVRLDKWLWAARFFKTRALAREAVMSGKVSYNGQRCKPSKAVELGVTIKVPQGYDVKEIIVVELAEHRRSAPLAQLMFEETPESLAQREKNAEMRKLSAFHSPKPDQRPDKKQRRQIIQLKHQ